MSLLIQPVTGIADVRPGDDLAQLLVQAVRSGALIPQDGDVVVITQKVVSKSEGRVVLEEPDGKAAWVERETRRVVARRGDLVIAETRHGLICANAGVDASNVESGSLTLLPEDADASAARLQSALGSAFGVSLAVVITDTFGRPWRNGVVNVAIGCAGMPSLVDLRGTLDASGRVLEATIVALADEIAAASGLAMGKAERVPAALVRGLRWDAPEAPASALVRAPEEDLFRESPLQAVAATGEVSDLDRDSRRSTADGAYLAFARSEAETATRASLGRDGARLRFSLVFEQPQAPHPVVAVEVPEGERADGLPDDALVGAAAQAYRIALRGLGVASRFVRAPTARTQTSAPQLALVVWLDPELGPPRSDDPAGPR